MRNKRKGYDPCFGPFTWASPDRDQGARCGDPACKREHPDHARRLSGTGELTEFCVICMTEHDE